MSFLQIDRNKCVNCGACADVCPASLIRITEDGPQVTGRRAECIACGQCVAVCPAGAVDNERAPLANQVQFDDVRLDPKTAALFLRSRRSIRSYRQERLPQETLLRIIDAARYAPTGGNSQGLSYVVISDRETLQKISATTIDWLEEEITKGSERAAYYKGMVQIARATGRDIILRDAPHLIVAACRKSFPRGAENAHFSLAYAELFAPALGVGTCWAGLFQGCAFSGYDPLLSVLDLPANKKVAGALMAGYPRHRYYRLADRNPLDVTWR